MPLEMTDKQQAALWDQRNAAHSSNLLPSISLPGAAAARRFGGAAASGRAAVRRRQLKKCLLVTPADHWPHVDSGISMKQTGAAQGSQ